MDDPAGALVQSEVVLLSSSSSSSTPEVVAKLGYKARDRRALALARLEEAQEAQAYYRWRGT